MDYWEKNGIKKPQEIIVCAANKFDSGLIITGARHWDQIMHTTADAIGKEKLGKEVDQGFINQFGEYRTRTEAMEIVKQNGQRFDIERNGHSDDILFSEGLY